MQTMKGWGLVAIGGNCGNGIAELEGVIDAMHHAAPDVRLIAKANAGIPQWRNHELIYDATPPVMGRYAQRVRALGACFIGGCCGNGPDHIAAIAEALRSPLSDADRAALLAEMADGNGNGAAEPAARERTHRRHRD